LPQAAAMGGFKLPEDAPSFSQLLSAQLATPAPPPPAANGGLLPPMMPPPEVMAMLQPEENTQEALALQQQQAMLEELIEEQAEEALEEERTLLERRQEGLDDGETVGEDISSELEETDDADPDFSEQEALDVSADAGGDDFSEAQRDAQDLADDVAFTSQERARDGGHSKETPPGGHQSSHQQQEEEAAEDQQLSFQEVQQLVETVLNSRSLPPKAHRLLQEVLTALLRGERRLLDQHRMVYLDAHDWAFLLALFPPRFFDGLMRPIALRCVRTPEEVPQWHALFQALLWQHPREIDLPLLQDLYAAVFPEPPGLLRHWLSGKSVLGNLATLQDTLEIMARANAFVPGCIGYTQQLAMQYHHTPETAEALFYLSQQYLHGDSLNWKETQLLARTLYEQCYTPEQFSGEQVVPVLVQALNGDPLDLPEIMLLLQGAGRQVLGHLPFYRLASELQELQQLRYSDPYYSEENLLALVSGN
jgi:hypothetical protein